MNIKPPLGAISPTQLSSRWKLPFWRSKHGYAYWIGSGGGEGPIPNFGTNTGIRLNVPSTLGPARTHFSTGTGNQHAVRMNGRDTSWLLRSNKWTIAVLGMFDDLTRNSDWKAVVAQAEGILDFQLMARVRNGTPPQDMQIWLGGSQKGTTASVVEENVPYLFVFRCDGNDNVLCEIWDVETKTLAAATTETFTADETVVGVTPLRVGAWNTGDSDDGWDGYQYAIYVDSDNRLTDNEVKTLVEDPFGPFRQSPRGFEWVERRPTIRVRARGRG